MKNSLNLVCPCSNSRTDKTINKPPVSISFYVECMAHVENLQEEVMDNLTSAEYNILKDCVFDCEIVDRDVNWYGDEYIQIRVDTTITEQQKLLLDLLGSMTYEVIL